MRTMSDFGGWGFFCPFALLFKHTCNRSTIHYTMLIFFFHTTVNGTEASLGIPFLVVGNPLLRVVREHRRRRKCETCLPSIFRISNAKA